MQTRISQSEAAVPTADQGTKKVRSSSKELPTISLRGMPIHVVSKQETVEHIIDCSLDGEGGWVVTPNLDILRRYRRNPVFRNLVASSSLNVADGMPLVWASRIKGCPVPERVNGTDLMVDLCEEAAHAGRSVYFLGGNPGTAQKTAEIMKAENPELEVAGFSCPDFGFESDIDTLEDILVELETIKPDIVFVGLGSPKQDVLINMFRMKLPETWWLGVGVSFSFVSGEVQRAPAWAKTSGFEWLFRLLAEPKRLAKRYLIQGMPFLFTTFVVCFYEQLTGVGRNKNNSEFKQQYIPGTDG